MPSDALTDEELRATREMLDNDEFGIDGEDDTRFAYRLLATIAARDAELQRLRAALQAAYDDWPDECREDEARDRIRNALAPAPEGGGK